MKNLILVIFIFFTTFTFSQNINDFEYVIVPEQYENFKNSDQYQLSTFSKSLFETIGFKVFYDNEILPEAIAKNQCLALKPYLEITSNMFLTKITIVLKDCYNKEIFRTEEGVCRKEKDNRVAHQLAFREAAKSLNEVNYKFSGKSLQKEQSITQIENQIPAKQDPKDFENILYAQEIENGFQLIDSTPKVIIKLTKTSSSDIFLANYNGSEGVVINKNNKWIFEFTQNGKLESHVLNIKF